MNDENDKPPAPPARKPKAKATMGFACGSGPCRTFRIYENPAQPPEPLKLPAPAEADTEPPGS
jgi:hypothetical protein